MSEKVERLVRLIDEDNVDELSKILNSNPYNFNTLTLISKIPLLFFAVREIVKK